MSDSDLIPDETAPAASAPQAPRKPKKKSMLKDPVVLWLSIFAAGLVIVYFITVASALLMGVLGSSEPKSKAERDLQVTAIKTQTSPKDTAAWRQYVLALIADRQFTKAQNVIDQAKVLKATGTEDMLLAQAELYYAKKDYTQAIKTAEEVRAKLQKTLEEAQGMKGAPQGMVVNDNSWQALLLIGEAHVQLKDNEAALKAFDEYLAEFKTSSDVFVRRGDLRAEMGDKAGAEADYREALRYIPNDAAALAGLKQIGVQQ